MPAKRRKPARVKISRVFGLPADLDRSLDAAAEARRQTRTVIVTIALEQYLSEIGFWQRTAPTPAAHQPAGTMHISRPRDETA